MLNIAYVIDTIETPNAGTESQLLMLLRGLDRSRFSPHLIVLKNSNWLTRNNLPFPVYNLDLKKLLSLKFLASLIRFKKYIKKHNIVIVQTFFRDANVFGTLAAYFSRIGVIISSRRNHGLGYWHNRYWLMLLKVLKIFTTIYIANSQTTKNYTVESEQVNPNKVLVIYNGLDTNRYTQLRRQRREVYRRSLGILPGQVLIGVIANLREVKNLPLFIKVAAILSKKYPDTRYIVVGDGPERDKLQTMINNFSLDGRVILAGEQDDVSPFLCSMDVGVLCSKSESLSNSILEYLATGLPSVVSNVGGNLEAIGYRNGLSFESNNLEDLCVKLEVLIVDSDLRKSLGSWGKSYACRKYNYKNIVKQYEGVYEQFYFANI